MASGLYKRGLEGFLAGDIDWDTDNIKVVLVDSGYTVDLDTHDALDAISVGDRVTISGNLGGKTVTDGAADADDVTFSGVSGDTIEAAVVYQDSGVESTSLLIAYVDLSASPVTPNGSDITLSWDDGAAKIFALSS